MFMHDPERMALFKPKTTSINSESRHLPIQIRIGKTWLCIEYELHDFALCDYVVYKYRIVNASTVCISMYDMTPASCRSRFFSVCDRAEIKKKGKVNKV